MFPVVTKRDFQAGREQVVVFEKQVNHLGQVIAGHEGLPKDGVGAQIQAHAQLQAQVGLAGQFKGIERQARKFAIFHSGAYPLQSGAGKCSACE